MTNRTRPEITYYDIEIVKERFWNKVIVGEHEECWPWIGATASNGYGVIVVGTFVNAQGKTRVYHNYAHRLSLEWDSGYPIPNGMYACHSCDNPPCVNPSHLWVGSQRDNMRDAIEKGRWYKGYQLDDAKQAKLFQMYNDGRTPREIMAALDINYHLLAAYLRGAKDNPYYEDIKLVGNKIRSSVRKVTPDEVRWVREIYKNKNHPNYLTIDEIAKQLGIDKSNVSRIARRIMYPDI